MLASITCTIMYPFLVGVMHEDVVERHAVPAKRSPLFSFMLSSISPFLSMFLPKSIFSPDGG